MFLLALYLACALAGAALAFWRSPRMPRYLPLLALAALPQLGSLLGIRIPGLFLVSVVAISIWCLCNRTIAGVPLAAVGIALNLIVMGLHGGAMPIGADVLARVGAPAAPGTLLAGSKDIVVQTAPLLLLSDWMVISSGLVTIVASPGDLLVVAGIIWWLLFSSQPERDYAHGHAWRRPWVGRPSRAPAPRPEHSAGTDSPGPVGSR